MKNPSPERSASKPAKQSGKKAAPVAGQQPFPIVGIGASAGGLEAIEQFLRQVPKDSGLAFVIVQHLDPTHKGVMPELLQRTTDMTVVQVTDRLKVEPNCVYIIPPNKNMSILHGALHLLDPTEPRGLRLPIDFFFISLAEDLKKRSIGVILSGMGSDGTIGLRAIKAQGGRVFVQEPTSAKFDSMPKSAIAADLADVVAPATELPGVIIAQLQHVVPIAKEGVVVAEKDRGSLEKIVILIRTRTGHDFSLYKKSTMYRRVERRMGVHQLGNISHYVRYLQENPQEIDFLFKEFLISVTNFFRDPAAWEQLQGLAINTIIANRLAGGTIRAWTTGCATGEEAYSLAISIAEAMKRAKPKNRINVQIFATDIDSDAIDRARQGRYPDGIAAEVSADLLQRYFVKEEKGYRISSKIREMVTFATQNVIMDPPFTKMDVLICRNLLIYLTPELQKMLVPMFHYSLNPGGYLFLGSAETISSFNHLFEPLNITSRLYQRRDSVLPIETYTFPASFIPALPRISVESTMQTPAPNIKSLADDLLLQYFSPPAVLVNNVGDILYVSGRTGKYLEPAAGKANWNIFAMARDGLRFDLGTTFKRALRDPGAHKAHGIRISAESDSQLVDITIQTIKKPEALQGMVMIIFTDVEKQEVNKKTPANSTSTSTVKSRDYELEQELRVATEELQTLREEMQTSREELTSTNEELQSTNEELQSTNEELTTSREEMQSLNEELQTVNAEQQSKMDELVLINNDMRNLLNSTEIITVFLDNQFNVRRFTTGANKLFKLLPGDVGRPLSDVSSSLIYPDMTEDAQRVLDTLVFSEKQITTNNGLWFNVRIMPYRTMDDVIGGVVITCANMTVTKKLEAELRTEIKRLKDLLDGQK